MDDRRRALLTFIALVFDEQQKLFLCDIIL